MQCMAKLIKGKRENLKINALDICMFIYSQIGSDNYLNLMNYSLQPEDVQAMGVAMESHRTNTKTKHVPLANVLRQRKTEMLMMKEQNPNLGNTNYGNENYGNENYGCYNGNKYY